MKTIGVIPARYQSSRFPGKPLADIHGKPMIWWVYQQAMKVSTYDDVIIATESDAIIDACKSLGMNAMMTSERHPTGTDRVAEVASKYTADIYIVIMGDEPLITAQEQESLIYAAKNAPEADAVMLMERFINPVDVVNTTTIKLAVNDKGFLIFMSRSPIPYPKASLKFAYYKNVGCYALRKEALDFYQKTKPGVIENIEEIELLRLLENHKRILTVCIDSESMSVDSEKDLERVREILSPTRF